MSEAIRRVGRGGEGAPRIDGCCACINRYELLYSEGRFAYRTSTSARSDEPLREKNAGEFRDASDSDRFGPTSCMHGQQCKCPQGVTTGSSGTSRLSVRCANCQSCERDPTAAQVGRTRCDMRSGPASPRVHPYRSGSRLSSPAARCSESERAPWTRSRRQRRTTPPSQIRLPARYLARLAL